MPDACGRVGGAGFCAVRLVFSAISHDSSLKRAYFRKNGKVFSMVNFIAPCRKARGRNRCPMVESPAARDGAAVPVSGPTPSAPATAAPAPVAPPATRGHAAAPAPARSASRASKSRQRNPLARLLDFAGSARKYTVFGCVLSGVNALCSIAMLVCVWFVLRDLVAAAPDFARAAQAPAWGLAAMGFGIGGLAVYFGALMLTHIAAFRTAKNMRMALLEHLSRVPLGFFSARSTGRAASRHRKRHGADRRGAGAPPARFRRCASDACCLPCGHVRVRLAVGALCAWFPSSSPRCAWRG